MKGHEGGQLSVFVVLMVVPIIALSGLVIDGGGVLAARQRAISDAFEAARAGAQALDIDVLRSSGVVVLEPTAARASALRYLAGAHDIGTVTVNGTNVTVTVSLRHGLTILSMFGIGPVSVSGTATAAAVSGVTGAGT